MVGTWFDFCRQTARYWWRNDWIGAKGRGKQLRFRKLIKLDSGLCKLGPQRCKIEIWIAIYWILTLRQIRVSHALSNLKVIQGSTDWSAERLSNLVVVTQLLSQIFKFAAWLSYREIEYYYTTETVLAHFESKECQGVDLLHILCTRFHPFGGQIDGRGEGSWKTNFVKKILEFI